MSELWRTTLERAQGRLEDSVRKHRPLRCTLVEYAMPEQRAREWPTLCEYNQEPPLYYGGGVYREVNVLHNPDGTTLFTTDRPVLDVNGKPYANTVGEAFAVERGAIRHIQVHGDYDAFQSFSPIAIEAASTLTAVPPEVRKLLAIETMRERNELDRWLYTLFDLAWRDSAGLPLRAERLAWVKNVTIPLRAIPIFRRQAAADKLAPPVPVLSQIPDPPDRFYSKLDNLAAASVAAIDILLAAASADKSDRIDAAQVHVVPLAQNPAATANPNAELLRLADNRIRLEIADQRNRLQNTIARGMEEMVATGALNSSATLRMLLGNCCDAISERAQIAWRTIHEHITRVGVVYHNGLREELKEAVGAHVPEDHADIADTLKKNLSTVRLYNLQLREKERLDSARKDALEKVSGEIDLLVLSLKNRHAHASAARQSLNVNVNGPVGALQVGNGNVANVAQQWTTEDRDALVTALRAIEEAVRASAMTSKDDLLSLLQSAKDETGKDKPNVSRLRAVLSDIGTTIRTIGSMAGAYQVLRVAAKAFGIDLP